MDKKIKKICLLFYVLYFGLSAIPNIQAESMEEIRSKIKYEIIEKREEYVKHYLNTDGTMTAFVYNDPIHYQDEKGNWIDIDNSLVEVSKENKTIFSKTTDNNFIELADNPLLDIKFNKKSSSKDLINLNINEHYVKIGIKNAAVGNANIRNATMSQSQYSLSKLKSDILYEDIFNSSDLDFKISSTNVLTEIIINNKADITTLIYNIETDLNVKQDNHGLILFYDENEQETEFILQVPYLYDSAEQSQVSDNVVVNLKESSTGYIVEYALDKEWLDNAVYPVTLSASQTVTNDRTRQNVLDTHVHPGDSAGDHVNQDRMYVGNKEGGSRAFINWSNFPIINGTINNASLDFNYWPGTSSWGPIDINQVNDAWDCYTINYNNSSSINYTTLYSNISPTLRTYQNFFFDITNTVKGWYSGSIGKNGFMIKYTNESYNDYNSIISSDSGINSAYWPGFAINYTPYSTTTYENLGWQYPLNTAYTGVTQEYSSTHFGIDIGTYTNQASIAGQPIYATQSGTIIWAGWSDTGGNMITIRSDSYDPNTGKQIIYNYMHMQSSALKTSGRVIKGEIIGYVGNTGVSTNYHLHVEMYAPATLNLGLLGASHYPGETINPREFYSEI